ncbi:MAG: [FeFe] hydrogenase H-cluster maturation GTPase HydF [Clostridia bacterium]
MAQNATPSANRLRIAIFGARNAGKSTLINALLGQNAAITSPIPGTTTDPVNKAAELHPLGPCVFTDTAGFDDEGELGALRIAKTRAVLDSCDIAILVFASRGISLELAFAKELDARNIPYIAVLNKTDTLNCPNELAYEIEHALAHTPVITRADTGDGIDALRNAIIAAAPHDFGTASITGHMVSSGDVVVLVMPQDGSAPKGRLILPQVQTIRDLLDGKCIVMCVTPDELKSALAALAKPPSLIITDSQVFKDVYENKPVGTKLTSFSVLFAKLKGDIDAFLRGANAIDALKDGDRVLIAEACTHNAQDADIARVKIPKLIHDKISKNLIIDVVSGNDFGDDLYKYALIIHCGACMFNRRYVMSRIAAATAANVPITNYGIAIAKLTGILPYIDLS